MSVSVCYCVLDCASSVESVSERVSASVFYIQRESEKDRKRQRWEKCLREKSYARVCELDKKRDKRVNEMVKRS